MQNPISMNTSHTSERLMSLIADGAKHFSSSHSILLCQKCSYATGRKKVCVSENISEKKFFVLSEYPEIEDENNQSSVLYSENSSTGILENLITKLGIKEDAYTGFGLKCVPSQNLNLQNFNTCITQHFLKELRIVKPKVMLCFGMRAFLTLTLFDSELLNAYQASLFDRNQKSFHFSFENQKIELYLFPTSQELKQFPKWRVDVWSKLSHFKKNIDS